MGFFNRIWNNKSSAVVFPTETALPSAVIRAPRTVIVLGGGGARGAAHLGVMRRIKESDLDISRLVGVSMGAFVGAMCAVDGDVESIQKRSIELIRSPSFLSKQKLLGCTDRDTRGQEKTGFFSWYQRLTRYLAAHQRCNRAVMGRSILTNTFLRQAIDSLVPDIQIDETATPLSIIAADLRTGKPIVLESGSLRTAVEASMAIPGIFQPVEHQGMLLCDIGTIHSLPIEFAKHYPHDLSIGVDVSQNLNVIADCSTALDVMIRMEEIGERMHRRASLHEADLIIRPHVHGIAWFDFHRVEALVDAGYQAANITLSGFSRRENGMQSSSAQSTKSLQ
ncbi:MAG TPA: patatin [Planctomycetaceae bacterium]|nr:patatin [Planctomycetaceae bacterium]